MKHLKRFPQTLRIRFVSVQKEVIKLVFYAGMVVLGFGCAQEIVFQELILLGGNVYPMSRDDPNGWPSNTSDPFGWSNSPPGFG
jgi:hypothetical protein